MFERFMNQEVLQGALDSKVDINHFTKVTQEKANISEFEKFNKIIELLDRKIKHVSIM